MTWIWGYTIALLVALNLFAPFHLFTKSNSPDSTFSFDYFLQNFEFRPPTWLNSFFQWFCTLNLCRSKLTKNQDMKPPKINSADFFTFFMRFSASEITIFKLSKSASLRTYNTSDECIPRPENVSRQWKLFSSVEKIRRIDFHQWKDHSFSVWKHQWKHPCWRICP